MFHELLSFLKRGIKGKMVLRRASLEPPTVPTRKPVVVEGMKGEVRLQIQQEQARGQAVLHKYDDQFLLPAEELPRQRVRLSAAELMTPQGRLRRRYLKEQEKLEKARVDRARMSW